MATTAGTPWTDPARTRAAPAPFPLYGDFTAGCVHVLTMDAANRVTDVLDFDLLANSVALKNRPNRNVYVLSFGEGKLHKYFTSPP